MRKDVLYECLKKLVKIRKEDLNGFFTASLRNRKFKISCWDRARIETLFNYGGDAKSNQLSMAMFYKDTPGKMDVVDPVAEDADANMGLKARCTFTKQSNTVDMMGPIHSDIFFQDRLILNGVNLRLKLNRAKIPFA